MNFTPNDWILVIQNVDYEYAQTVYCSNSIAITSLIHVIYYLKFYKYYRDIWNELRILVFQNWYFEWGYISETNRTT